VVGPNDSLAAALSADHAHAPLALTVAGAHTLSAIFDAALLSFSELWIDSDQAAGAPALLASHLTLLHGAPPLHLSGVRLYVDVLQGHQIAVEGSTLVLTNCTLTTSAHLTATFTTPAVNVSGVGVLIAHGTVFEDSANTLTIAEAATVNLHACTLRRLANGVVVRGGTLLINSSSLVDDSATALHVEGGNVVLADHTVLLRNARSVVVDCLPPPPPNLPPSAGVHGRQLSSPDEAAATGPSSFGDPPFHRRLQSGSVGRCSVSYELPAPLGRWAFDPVNAGISYLPLSTTIESDYPYACSAGLLGESYASQSTPGCSGPCPAGSWCGMGSHVPTPCEVRRTRIARTHTHAPASHTHRHARRVMSRRRPH
jgi:hypothetical protein